MKKLLAVILFIIAMGALSACNANVTYEVKSDQTITASAEYDLTYSELAMMIASFDETYTADAITEEMVDALLFDESANNSVTKKMINGELHYIIQGAEPETTTTTEMAESADGFIISENEFYATADAIDEANDMSDSASSISGADAEGLSELQSMMSITLTVKLPKEIVFTNGKLSKDKKSVTFNTNSGATSYYAYTADSDKIISLTGIDAKGYTKKSTIKVSTPDKISSIKVNGTSQTGKSIPLNKDGKYTIEIKTKNSSKTFNVIKDTTAPSISGIKNDATYTNKVTIKFSDKTSGISSAKLNGKKIKNGATVTKPGNYTLKVIDKAGNKTTVKFTIKNQ